MEAIKTDIVIIGAGPTGLSLACQFVRYSVDFVILEPVRRFLFPLLSQTGINYRHSSVSRHADDEDFKVKAGDRMPYFLVDGKSVYERHYAPKFHLIIVSDERGDFQGLKTEVERQYAELVDFNGISLDPQVAKAFGTERPFNVLLRPDNYIGYISTKTSFNELKTYLKDFVGYS